MTTPAMPANASSSETTLLRLSAAVVRRAPFIALCAVVCAVAAAGLSLGRPIRIEEEGEGMPVRPMGMLRAAAESVPTEIAGGEIEITARVRAWFAVG
jgi:hypothetical protein